MLRLLREPLLHFLGLAALLFVSNAYLAGDEREVITVDAATRDYLVQQRRDLLLRPLTTREESDVIDKFVKDEILVREARKRGFGNSSRIRIQLIQNMRFFLTSEFPEPTDADRRTRRRLPHLRRSIRRCRHHPSAVCTEGGGEDRRLMAQWLADRRTRRRRPHLRRSIRRCRHHPNTICTEGGGEDHR